MTDDDFPLDDPRPHSDDDDDDELRRNDQPLRRPFDSAGRTREETADDAAHDDPDATRRARFYHEPLPLQPARRQTRPTDADASDATQHAAHIDTTTPTPRHDSAAPERRDAPARPTQRPFLTTPSYSPFSPAR